jgi:hypothetical protein
LSGTFQVGPDNYIRWSETPDSPTGTALRVLVPGAYRLLIDVTALIGLASPTYAV